MYSTAPADRAIVKLNFQTSGSVSGISLFFQYAINYLSPIFVGSNSRPIFKFLRPTLKITDPYYALIVQIVTYTGETLKFISGS